MAETDLIRSFIAIPISAPIKASVAAIQDRLKPSLPDIRWTKPESLHLTLHFFGDIDEESLEKAASVMVSIESLFSPFSMTLSGVGAFPSPNRSRVLWLGVKCKEISALHSALIGRLTECGFSIDKRPFTPHLTLGRIRGRDQDLRHILSPGENTVAGEMTVNGLTLFESRLLPTGAEHRPRQTINFPAD
jgi:2'-5' RNA ligase